MSGQDTGTTRGVDAQVLRDLIGLAFEQGDLAFALNRVTNVVAAAVEGADDVSVTLDDKVPRTVAFSGELAADADESQYDVDSGPCLQAMRENEVVRVDDLETETRWPAYRPRGLSAGVRSSLSLPLPAGDRIVGALNIYSRTTKAFDESLESHALEIASYAGVVLANAELFYAASDRAEQMRQAMESRAVIEQAKGVLMAQRGGDAEQAFFVLVRLSQTTHRKLREVATDLVAEAIRG